MLDVPRWLAELTEKWADRIDLSGWEVDLVMALAVDDNVVVDAMCHQDWKRNRATITLRADAEDTPYWRKNLIHELLHIAHARVDEAVEHHLIPHLGPLSEIANDIYTGAYESYTQRLATALYDLMEPCDYPDERTAAA